MAKYNEQLAASLKKLQKLQQQQQGVAIIKSSDLSQLHLSRLLKSGFLMEVMKGWYISSRPDVFPGDTTPWYISYWSFVTAYADARFGKENWCLSPEQSLLIYSGEYTVPRQTILRSPLASNNLTNLLYETSVFDLKTTIATSIQKETRFQLNLYSLAEALIECNQEFYRSQNVAVRTCLSLVRDTSEILAILLEKGQSFKAGRLAGAFRNMGKNTFADEILRLMKDAGYDVREKDPFEESKIIDIQLVENPYEVRFKLMWAEMRETVLLYFPEMARKQKSVDDCLAQIDASYQQDAYNSLSIEGYQVSNDLIDRVKSGSWQPDVDASDSQQRNAMAAKGYWLAFQSVRNSVLKILQGGGVGEILDKDHIVWYRELFSPMVHATLLNFADLSGYRNHQVYIRGSKHVPLSSTAVRQAMPVLFDLLKKEPNAAVRAVLGHFFFAYIHPYMDGNGRLARFLMNTQWISGGYDWMIVPVARREEYMKALEKASTQNDISDFCIFLSSLLK